MRAWGRGEWGGQACRHFLLYHLVVRNPPMTIPIPLLVGLGRATRPCAARCRLLRRINTGNRALCAQSLPPHGHRSSGASLKQGEKISIRLGFELRNQ